MCGLVTCGLSLTGTSTATLAAIGAQYGLLLSEKGEQLKPLAELRALYAGEAATPQTADAALWIENPLQVVPITSIGDNAEVVASFVLKNRGDKPFDLAVASTSCGCTSATLDLLHFHTSNNESSRLQE